MRPHPILVMAVLIWAGTGVAKGEEMHPGKAVLLRYMSLINQGDMNNARMLERRSPEIPPDAWQRIVHDMRELAGRTPLKVQESWEIQDKVFGVTGEINLSASRKVVLVIGTSETDGQWFVSTFTVHRPARWEKTRARIVAEGGKLVSQAENSVR